MGLFSRKSKQDRLAEDSGRFYSKDDDAAAGARARAKRASNAGGGATRRPGNDPLLPEKKRARRRLVGAIALALAAAVGLPMLLDSEPKPLAGDIAIQIPAKDKAAPLPVPSADKTVAAEDSVDQDEEVVPAEGAKPAGKPAAVAAAPKAEPAQPALPKAEAKPETRLEPKPEPKVDTRAAERERLERERAEKERIAHERAERERADRERAERAAKAEHERAEKLAKQKAAEEKPVKPAAKPEGDSARAMAILEGKPADKPADKDRADAAGQKVVVQVIATASADKAAEVQGKLREAGISSYTQKTTTSSGELIRVRVGPFSRDEAEKVRAKLGRIGMSGAITPV
ncbi:SPOR domain-containing protein [Massilia sp. YIM B02763]|uniref:SPOR domain-containing protein n=1 Tax=Massilia sp. YIM B02763 TaxID=3050130 RepID=UPI0025B6D6A2|nr:SPOR domain-containing protein [Massilia sp. YIM B02763]MDN4052841.1 SPOR domain-containing protein [Massilia sp. YIM B02763]